jgi:hypothetical protein
MVNQPHLCVFKLTTVGQVDSASRDYITIVVVVVEVVVVYSSNISVQWGDVAAFIWCYLGVTRGWQRSRRGYRAGIERKRWL